MIGYGIAAAGVAGVLYDLTDVEPSWQGGLVSLCIGAAIAVFTNERKYR